MTGDLNLPFEPQEPTYQELDPDTMIAGGVVVMAAAVPVPALGVRPALVFRFATPLGGFHPPVLLVLDDDEMDGLRPLLSAAIHRAREAAKRGVV